ncbi:YggN family protein [Pseudoxanthomonas sp. LH2527]|uniref:YggN family protein n=1 Tax=Pseudoxanthomonas sp. LH2527 TaxID=2923249 RepID=UPI001F135AF4|nr:YggN family protein [Pseudoxanthomonas sp. LH2527]MCH6481992.1 YggN family protein [Pseudoxanthomonas sp. LH2527]
MHKNTLLIRGAGIAAALMLAACQPAQDKQDTAPTGIAAEAMGEVAKGLGEASQEMEKARAEIATAREKLARENISLNRNESQSLPKAEITPAGELLIEGKPVATTPEQKALVLAYRGELLGVVGDGMAIGMEGARVGIDAAASALKGVLAGQSGDEIGQQVGEQAKAKIKPMVAQLCTRLPGLLGAQQALATALPEFKPYASMDQSDVDDCGDANGDGNWTF